MKDPRRADVYKVFEALKLNDPEFWKNRPAWKPFKPKKEPRRSVTKTRVIPPPPKA